eukprot:UN15088
MNLLLFSGAKTYKYKQLHTN